jgi:hypothetical protein
MDNKIQLFVAGVIHQDPLGRPRVQHWLRELLLRERRPPTFVAVEWDKDDLARIVSQRPHLAELAKAQWPNATEEFIDGLADAAGYEGDSHATILPSAETLWLDEGRKPDEEEIERFTEFRMVKYKALAVGLEKFDFEGLKYMSAAAWNNVLPRVEGTTPRDEKFATRLYTAFGITTSNWAIAILGADHTADSPGSAIDLLIHIGISCNVTNMSPDNI